MLSRNVPRLFIVNGSNIVDIFIHFVKNSNMARKKLITNRRAEILQAADRLFTHYGFAKTTMEDISREAGIPRATIYLEFPGGKEDILMAHLQDFMEQTLAEMQRAAKTSKTGRLEALRQAILFCILSAHDKATHQFDPSNIEKCSNRIRNEMGEFFKRRDAFYADMLRQAALAGEIQEQPDYEALAALISQSCIGWMPLHTMTLPREAVERGAGTCLSMMLTGLANAKSPRKLSV
jgi:AcrR family transcriptional regulator